jgi:Protein of unknown function (DUF3800)
VMRSGLQAHAGIPIDTIEVACDESGSEGEHLIGGNTDVFAHGSVHFTPEAAAAVVQEVRDRIRSPATEYKANHLLRQKQRTVLEWILGPEGPLLGRAHVHLTDKPAFVLSRLVDALIEDVDERVVVADALAADGRTSLGVADWDQFLGAANALLRSRPNRFAPEPVLPFFALTDQLAAVVNGRVRESLLSLGHGRDRAEALRDEWTDVRRHPPDVPLLEPLLPAMVATVVFWAGNGRRVRVVHDETNTLTDERLAHLHEVLGPTLVALRMVDSQHDPRVQLADYLAGVARKLASEARNGRADATLVALLRPYVDADSVWGDPASGALLGLTDPRAETVGR